MRILFTGGGTGGHIYPIIAVKRVLEKLYEKEIKFLYVGPDDFASGVFKKEGGACRCVLAGKIRRYFIKPAR